MARTPDQNRAYYHLRAQRAREAGYRSYRGQREARRVEAGQRALPSLPRGVDVSAAGTAYTGNNSRTLYALAQRAAAVMGTGAVCVLVVNVNDLEYDPAGKGPARSGGYGVVNEAEDEVTISIPDESGFRDDETGQWVADGFTLGDILAAVDNEGGDIRAGIEDLVLATVGIVDVGQVDGFTLTIPDYHGG